MGDDSPYRNSKGGLAVGALVTTFVGIILQSWAFDVIETIGLVFGGFADNLNGFAQFSTTGIDLYYLIGENLLGGAFTAHEAWIRSFGVFAPIASTVEIALLVWLLLGLSKAILSELGGAFG